MQAQGGDRDYRARFYRAVDQRQALDERQAEFYVPIYDDPALQQHDLVATMRDVIDFTGGSSTQVLSGFRGSGKTSELLRLQQDLTAAGHVVAYMDVEDFFNTELPLDLPAFLVALAAGFAAACADLTQDQVGQEAPWSRFRRLLSRLQIDIGVGVGPVDVSASLRDDPSFRARVQQALAASRAEFRLALHEYIGELAADLSDDGRVVLIVDSIDHFRGRTERFQAVRESVEAIFSEGAEEIQLPGLHVIYTVPVYVQPAIGLRRDVLNIKVADPSGAPFEPGRDALRSVLARRAPGNDYSRLVDGDERLVDRLIESSGGLFRDLLRLTAEVILGAQRLPVTSADVARSESVVRGNMQMAMSREQLDILRSVRDTHALIPSRDEWADATDLMARGAVLRYPNGEQAWYGVHPLLLNTL